MKRFLLLLPLLLFALLIAGLALGLNHAPPTHQTIDASTLLTPPLQMNTLALWLAPGLILLVAGASVLRFILQRGKGWAK